MKEVLVPQIAKQSKRKPHDKVIAVLKTAPCHLSQTEIHLLWQHSSHPGPVNSASQRRRRAVKPTRHLARGRGTSTSGPICMTRPGRRASESSTPNTSACKLVCINPLYRSPRKNAGDPQVVFLTALWGHFSERGAKKQKRCELLPQRPSSTTPSRIPATQRHVNCWKVFVVRQTRFRGSDS